MKKIMRNLLVLIVIASMTFSLVGCAGNGEDKSTSVENESVTEESTGDVFIRNTASSMGGIWYPMASAMNIIWQKNIDGIGCKVVPGKSAENVKLITRGETEVAWCHSVGIMAAYNGVSPYDDGLDYKNEIAHIATIHPAAIHIIVREGSDIGSLGDLNGKRVGFASIGSSLNEAIVDLLELYGVTEETIVNAGGTVLNVSNSESATLMQDGQIDVYFSQATYPSTDFQEMENNVRFLGIEQDKLDEFLTDHANWKLATIPDGTYKNQDGDLNTFSSYVMLACRANMDEELVYQMTKTMWENLQDIHDVSADAKRFMSLDIALTCEDIIPIHPGAKRYYKEIGLMK